MTDSAAAMLAPGPQRFAPTAARAAGAPGLRSELRAPAYPTEWTIADAASHLGSGAVISGLRFAAGARGCGGTGQRRLRTDLGRVERQGTRGAGAGRHRGGRGIHRPDHAQSTTPSATPGRWRCGAPWPTSSASSRLRVNEHVMHTWDIAVALDPAARLDPHGVELLIDQLLPLVRHTAQPHEPLRIHVVTTAPTGVPARPGWHRRPARLGRRRRRAELRLLRRPDPAGLRPAGQRPQGHVEPLPIDAPASPRRPCAASSPRHLRLSGRTRGASRAPDQWVPSAGFEPAHTPPEGDALSPELRGPLA